MTVCNDATLTKRQQQYLDRLRNFRLLGDDFMVKVFENKKCAELLLQIILQRDDLTVHKVECQRAFNNLKGHSIRLDIYATDRNGVVYDIEIQRSDSGAAPKRARYYSSLIDADILDPGEEYQNPKEKYVIFITENDVLKGNLPIYHIDWTVRETCQPFDDGSHIIYVNARITDDTTALGRLMHDFWCINHKDMIHPVLANEVRHYKEDEKGVQTMCKAMEELCNEVANETREEMAIALIGVGKLSYEEIALSTKLPIEKIKELADTN